MPRKPEFKMTAAQQKLVSDFIWVADWCARDAVRKTGGHTGIFSFEDLRTEALIGMCVASTRFDASKGYSPVTWLKCYGKGYIQHALAARSRLVRIPGKIRGLRGWVREQLLAGRKPEDIATDIGRNGLELVYQCEASWPEMHVSIDLSRNTTLPSEDTSDLSLPQILNGDAGQFKGQEKEIWDRITSLKDRDLNLLMKFKVYGNELTQRQSKRANKLLGWVMTGNWS